MSLEIEGGLDLQIAASLKASADAAQERNSRERRLEELVPVDAQIQAAGVYPSSGDLVIDCGGPTSGRAWVLRRLNVSGPDPTVAIAGSAYVFFSAGISSGSLVGPNWIDVASSLPLVGWYTSRQVVLRSPMHLVVKITGGTAGDTYSVSGYAMDESTHPAAARYTL